jgi:hypothetical protein
MKDAQNLLPIAEPELRTNCVVLWAVTSNGTTRTKSLFLISLFPQRAINTVEFTL